MAQREARRWRWQKAGRFKTTGACKHIQIWLNERHMMLGSRREGTLSPVSSCLSALLTSTQSSSYRVSSKRLRSGSNPLTRLATLRSPHFLMALSYTAIKARDQTARPADWEIIGRTRRTCGSRGTVRPLARKWLMSLVMETNIENEGRV